MRRAAREVQRTARALRLLGFVVALDDEQVLAVADDLQDEGIVFRFSYTLL